MYSLIVFDCDGTLVDSESRIIHCMQTAASELGLPISDEKNIRNVIGLGLTEAIRDLYPQVGLPIVHLFIHQYRRCFFELEKKPSPLFPGVESMLSDLHVSGLRLAVATGKGRKGLNLVLNNTELKKYFIASRCADETRSKPHPQMLIELMDELSVSPEQTAMVGDTSYDMEMALRAGVDGIAVSYGVHEIDRLGEHQPKFIAETVSDLSSWLNARLQK